MKQEDIETIIKIAVVKAFVAQRQGVYRRRHVRTRWKLQDHRAASGQSGGSKS